MSATKDKTIAEFDAIQKELCAVMRSIPERLPKGGIRGFASAVISAVSFTSAGDGKHKPLDPDRATYIQRLVMIAGEAMALATLTTTSPPTANAITQAQMAQMAQEFAEELTKAALDRAKELRAYHEMMARGQITEH